MYKMAKRNTRPIRADQDFIQKFINEIRRERMLKHLDSNPHELTDAEITRMMTRAPSARRLRDECSTLPRRRPL